MITTFKKSFISIFSGKVAIKVPPFCSSEIIFAAAKTCFKSLKFNCVLFSEIALFILIISENEQMSDKSHFKWIQPRDPGSINWYGLWTLYKKEVQRFFKILSLKLLGFVNYNNGNMIGFQLGFLNKAETVTGLQFGLINLAGQLDNGLQIGLINVVDHGKAFPFMPIVNWSF